MDHDGVKNGYANDALSQLSQILTIPSSLREEQEARNTLEMLLLSEKADAALAASVFHFGEIPIPELKHTFDKKESTLEFNFKIYKIWI